MGLKNRGRTRPVTTNIGATVPPRAPAPGFALPGRHRPQTDPRTGLPIALPVAAREGEPSRRVVAADPLWISRWQNSTSPPDERPWVRGFRWWVPNVQYATWGPTPENDYRIDFLWKDHRHAYHGIPRPVWEQLRAWTGSVGEWFHDNILVPDWKPGRGARYPNFPL
jgi:hypothetical protein